MSLFIEVPVPSQESELSYIWDIDFASFLDFLLRIWNCSDIVVLFALHLSIKVSHSFISIMG